MNKTKYVGNRVRSERGRLLVVWEWDDEIYQISKVIVDPRHRQLLKDTLILVNFEYTKEDNNKILSLLTKIRRKQE